MRVARKSQYKTEKEKQRTNLLVGLLFLALFTGVYLVGYLYREPVGNDHYRDMKELLRKEPDTSYEFNIQKRESPVLIVTPHGGRIELFTSVIGNGLAGSNFSHFEFRGLLEKGSYEKLHVTSVNYNPPKLIPLNKESEITLSVHGLSGSEKVTYVGGRDVAGAQMVRQALEAEGFLVETPPSNYNGKHVKNFVNRNKRGKGIQLEIALGQRRALFTKGNEEMPNEDYERYIGAVTKALEALAASDVMKE